jgi:hypothetical protein
VSTGCLHVWMFAKLTQSVLFFPDVSNVGLNSFANVKKLTGFVMLAKLFGSMQCFEILENVINNIIHTVTNKMQILLMQFLGNK